MKPFSLKKALSLTALSSLLGKTKSMGQQEKTLRQKRAYSQYGKKYLEKAYKSFNVDPTAHRAVQSLKRSLHDFPDVVRHHHPYHYGMPPQNKQVYTAKRMEAMKRLANAKMLRASQKLKTNLQPSKRSKLEKRIGSHCGTKR